MSADAGGFAEAQLEGLLKDQRNRFGENEINFYCCTNSMCVCLITSTVSLCTCTECTGYACVN